MRFMTKTGPMLQLHYTLDAPVLTVLVYTIPASGEDSAMVANAGLLQNCCRLPMQTVAELDQL